MSVMVDNVRERTSKKSCKYGKYGSFQKLLFLCRIKCMLLVISRIYGICSCIKCVVLVIGRIYGIYHFMCVIIR